MDIVEAACHLDSHAYMSTVEEDVLVAPGGQPGSLVGAPRAKAADGLQSGHHLVDECRHQRAAAIPPRQHLSQLLSQQNISLPSTQASSPLLPRLATPPIGIILLCCVYVWALAGKLIASRHASLAK